MWERSGSQSFRATTRMQSGLDICGKSRLIVTLLTILGFTEILYSFRLVVERKTGKEIPESLRLEFLEKFSANNLYQMQKATPSESQIFGSFVLLVYASLAASRTLLQGLQACLNFTLDTEDLFCWYNWKKWTIGAAEAAENYGDKWGLTWYLWCWIYTSISTWTHSQNPLAAAEAPSLKISSHRTSLKWSHFC